MQRFEIFLEYAAKLGLWDFLTFTIGLLSAIAALIYFSRRKHDRFSLYPSYRIGTGHSLYPNVIYFSARNLGDLPIVVCRPNFTPSQILKVDDYAHGNLVTEDYELKFRPVNSRGEIIEGSSYTTVLLRHRDEVMAYLPISRDYDASTFSTLLPPPARGFFSRFCAALFGEPSLGCITFDIVTVGEGKPRVVRMSQRITRVALESRNYKLGFDPACQSSSSATKT